MCNLDNLNQGIFSLEEDDNELYQEQKISRDHAIT